MTIVTLPDWPGPAKADWREQDFGGTLPGLLGGPTDRDNRLGNRWAIDVKLPQMSARAAMAWSADLSLGLKQRVRWRLRQLGLPPGPIGAPLVDGAEQMGMSLAAAGFTPGAAWEKGQFIGVVSGGRSRLYKLAAGGFADAEGEGVLALTTALRAVPGDEDVIDFAPSIEGLLSGDAVRWTIDNLRLGHVAFAIDEDS
ncbi:MAG TPA: hypothetical protein PKD99_02245 [Sphingopyxis sp.]|nr:hypothetical protein [Sphingopyxis sp.]HMP43897.1 hypothetical protein [Sphingopyxis sp.]HMQ18064.1 hypothetical protein [Sphingopyxis sp.]